MFAITVLSVLLVSISQVLGTICPPDSEIQPCTCVAGVSVKCVSNSFVDLDSVFETINKLAPGAQYFDTVELTGNGITGLDNEIFNGVLFRQLKITACPNLKCVQPRAFHGLDKHLTHFITMNADFSEYSANKCDLFQALNGLNVLTIVNIFESNIKEIPEKAFNNKLGQQLLLNTLDFSGALGGQITKIGTRAFASLRGLKVLDLSGHKIDTIADLAFSFDDPWTDTLLLNLENQNDKLLGSSFGKSAFEVNGRVTTIRLGINKKLQYLDSNAFYTFLENKANGKNKIDLNGSPLYARPENEWLLEYKAKFELQEKISNARDTDGLTFWRHSKQDNGFQTTTKYTGPPTTTPKKPSSTFI